MGGHITALDQTNTIYLGLMGDANFAHETTESTRNQIVSTSGTFKELRVELDGDPGAGNSYAFTVMKDGSPTSITCTISGTDTTCNDMVNTSAATANSLYSLRIVPTSTPDAQRIRFSIIFDGDTEAESILMGVGIVFVGVDGTPIHGTVASYASNDRAETTMATSGTLKNFYITNNVGPGVGVQYVYGTQVDNVTAAITCTIDNPDVACSDLTNTVSVVAGDLFQLRRTDGDLTTSPIAPLGMTFLADTDGEFGIYAVQSSQGSQTDTQYFPVSAGNAAQQTTEAIAQQLAPAFTAKAMYVQLDGSPGAGNKHTYTLQVDGSPTALTCEVADAAETCNVTADVVIAQDSLIDYMYVPDSSPSVRRARIGLLGFIEPEAAASQVTLYGSTITGGTLQ